MQNKFWETYQQCLTAAVAANPSEYMLRPGETPEQYAARVAPKMERAGVRGCDWRGAGFRRTATALGVKFTQAALIAAEQAAAQEAAA